MCEAAEDIKSFLAEKLFYWPKSPSKIGFLRQ